MAWGDRAHCSLHGPMEQVGPDSWRCVKQRIHGGADTGIPEWREPCGAVAGDPLPSQPPVRRKRRWFARRGGGGR